MSYNSPKLVDLSCLKVVKYRSPWLVQLDIGEKRRVTAKVEDYPVEIEGQ